VSAAESSKPKENTRLNEINQLVDKARIPIKIDIDMIDREEE
jgi:hypothetical protein